MVAPRLVATRNFQTGPKDHNQTFSLSEEKLENLIRSEKKFKARYVVNENCL